MATREPSERIADALERIAASLEHQMRSQAGQVLQPTLSVRRAENGKNLPPITYSERSNQILVHVTNAGAVPTNVSRPKLFFFKQSIGGGFRAAGGAVQGERRLADGESCMLVFQLDIAASSLVNTDLRLELHQTVPRFAEGATFAAPL